MRFQTVVVDEHQSCIVYESLIVTVNEYGYLSGDINIGPWIKVPATIIGGSQNDYEIRLGTRIRFEPEGGTIYEIQFLGVSKTPMSPYKIELGITDCSRHS